MGLLYVQFLKPSELGHSSMFVRLAKRMSIYLYDSTMALFGIHSILLLFQDNVLSFHRGSVLRPKSLLS